ncbi:MAG: OmpA family protein [Clostridia bacterium]|nr:OmpA family protein [Clostridia bacterium]
MGSKKYEQEETAHGNSERWMLTYADLITLLLIFFIVMYAMSSLNQKKFEQMSMSLKVALIGENPGHIIGQSPGPDIVPGAGRKGNEEENKIEEIKKALEKYINEKQLESKVGIRLEERGLVISLREALLFKLGSADLASASLQVLDEVTNALETMPNPVRVEGHTDNLPIKTARFPSNWELSTARATNVVRYMIQVGYKPQNISAIGYGEYRPLSPNTAQGNPLNRRVDLVLLRSNYDKGEAKKQ